MTDSNRMLVLSGPSGSGKSTIVNRVIDESPVAMMKMVSATTRPPREGEVDGEAYWFLFRRRSLPVGGKLVSLSSTKKCFRRATGTELSNQNLPERPKTRPGHSSRLTSRELCE